MVPVSLTVPQFSTDPHHLLALATSASEYGFNGLFAFDHLVPLGDPHRPVFELTSILGALGASSTVTVGSLVMRVTLRPPEISAAAAATLVALAPGRAVLGLGVGDSMSAEEARRFGQALPTLEERLSLLGETIAAVRAVAPTLPVWVGGRHRLMRELAAQLADGWNAWGASVEELSAEADEVRAMVGSKPFAISWGGTLLLAPDAASLEKQIADRGGSQGTVAGTPLKIKSHLERIGSVVDEIIVSVVPNRSPNWELFSQAVLGA
ncbi:MAG: LLM class flavin-dependent oxidoreductase [Acidimicrobiia bacterium]